jgi:hypothetical protein
MRGRPGLGRVNIREGLANARACTAPRRVPGSLSSKRDQPGCLCPVRAMFAGIGKVRFEHVRARGGEHVAAERRDQLNAADKAMIPIAIRTSSSLIKSHIVWRFARKAAPSPRHPETIQRRSPPRGVPAAVIDQNSNKIVVRVLGPAARRTLEHLDQNQSGKSAALDDAKTRHSAVLCPFLSRTARKWL